ncbi:MAG: ferrous iron transport protein [Bacillota bacterium]|nr:ferrous iron transport protein [Bacillota bacterium]MDK2927573.1 ferrous iron transport protein [Bacillota bacterium]
MFGRRSRWRRGRGGGRRAARAGGVRTVADLAPAEKAAVLGLAPAAPRDLNKLMALGVLPGAPLTLLQRSPSLVVQVGETVLALDEKIARTILVGPSLEG